MKKFFVALLLMLMAVVMVKAGTLADYYQATVKPAASFEQAVPAAQVAQMGVAEVTNAIISADLFATMAANEFAAPVERVLSEEDPMGKAIAWELKDGDNSELLMAISAQGQNMVIFVKGPEAAIEKMLQQ